jgi:hypothetical protein
MKKNVVIFDMDQTLIDSPVPEDGKVIWKEKTGQEYPHTGWWGRKESLDLDILDIQPNPHVLQDYILHKENGDIIFLVTGRLEKLRPEVERILNHHGLTFNGIYLRDGGKDTLDYKINLFDSMMEQFEPDTFTIYEDRFEHVTAFKEWSNKYDITIKINFV